MLYTNHRFHTNEMVYSSKSFTIPLTTIKMCGSIANSEDVTSKPLSGIGQLKMYMLYLMA